MLGKKTYYKDGEREKFLWGVLRGLVAVRYLNPHSL